MNEAKLYYTAPSDAIFEEVRQAAMGLWKDIDTDNDKFGYASEKINQIKDIANVKDNFMFIVAMFDIVNMARLAGRISDEARIQIRERMLDGGNDPELIPF